MLKFLMFALLVALPAQAELPLYEIGAAFGSGYLADYPGSDQGRSRFIILPSAIYRGETFKSDANRGTRANFYQSRFTNIDLSFGASFPANSKDNNAREGMNDLDWLGEVGPRFNNIIYKDGPTSLEIEIPLRFIFSTDFEFTKARGYRLQPQLDLRHFFGRYLMLNMSFKLNWATEALHDYFYEVKAQDIRPNRQEYNAKPGYLGRSLSSFFIYEFGDLFCVFGARYSDYRGSVNEQSPLFRANNDTAVFLAFNYFFHKSKERAYK